MLKRDAGAERVPPPSPGLLRRSSTRRGGSGALLSIRVLPGALLAVALLAALATGCGAGAEPPIAVFSSSTPTAVATSPAPQPTAVAEPSPSPEPETPTPTATPESTSTPAPAVVRVFTPVEAQVVTATVSRAAPSMSSRAVRDLPALSRVGLVAEERGENWIIGDQDWVPVSHAWESTWYRLGDGSYVHRAFVFLPDRASVPAAGGAERYVIIDLDAQLAWAMEGAAIVREMPITTGKRGFETPSGEFRVLESGRILNERMTSQRAGFDDPNDTYDVERVLYTQYFAEGGFALHLNYWQPAGVFGNIETSHGCVGMLLEDAQFLWMFGRAGMRVVVRNGGGPQPLPAPTPPPSTLPLPPVDTVKIFAVQDGASGAKAVVAARTVPGSSCTLTQAGPIGMPWSSSLGSRVADAAGWLEWTWTIEPGAPPGKGSVTVTCPGSSGAWADFTVR